MGKKCSHFLKVGQFFPTTPFSTLEHYKPAFSAATFVGEGYVKLGQVCVGPDLARRTAQEGEPTVASARAARSTRAPCRLPPPRPPVVPPRQDKIQAIIASQSLALSCSLSHDSFSRTCEVILKHYMLIKLLSLQSQNCSAAEI